MGTQAAYAQANTPDKAVAKMTITGIAGDNADGTIEVVGIDQRLSNPIPTGTTNPPPTPTRQVGQGLAQEEAVEADLGDR